MSRLSLESLKSCFVGIVPAAVATCDPEGVPNVTFVSQLHYVDEKHVALSCQFFNKTRRNLGANPRATAQVFHPLTFQAYELDLRYLRSEKSGPLFDAMAARIQAIATHTGMQGVFRLISADVCEVLSIQPIPFLKDSPEIPAPTGDCLPPGPMTEVRRLQQISARINRAKDLDDLLTGVLDAAHELFGFEHSMVLLPDESGKRLVTIASHGYGPGGIGAEAVLGEGLIGTAAERRAIVSLSGVGTQLRYGRTIRGRVQELGGSARPEIPLPGLSDAQCQLVLPLLVCDRLVGVLAVESRDPLAFNDLHQAYLEVIADQIALGIEHRMLSEDDDAAEHRTADAHRHDAAAQRGAHHSFCFYKNDDCVFVDGEYLIRNVPGKILWKVLRSSQRERRFEFTNRELRLDQSLGLPEIRDNLESRLLLLRKRLAEKCPDVKLVPVKRGRFALELECDIELVERDSA